MTGQKFPSAADRGMGSAAIYPALKGWIEATKSGQWLIKSAELDKQLLSADPRHRLLDDRSATV